MPGTTSKPSIRKTSYVAAARIVVTYAIFALLWILLSDKAMAFILTDPATLIWVSIIKGWTFVLVTSALLFVLVARLVHRIELTAERERQNRQRKAAEFRAHSLRVHAQLEERVEARTAELTAANRELDAFAYAVSHDLRAPLRAMSGFSDALIEDYGDRLDGEARQYLDQIVLASRRMSELIDGILVLSRSTRSTLEYLPVNLSELAAGQVKRLHQIDPKRKIEVKIEPDLTATGDPRTLAVVMNNLIDNAWKYTLDTDAARIVIRAGELDDLPAVCVEDNGAGFDMAHADKLFKAFQRLHRQDEFPGTGIGLATVSRIIQRHGGRIEGSGSPGQGACFCFALPARPRQEDSP